METEILMSIRCPLTSISVDLIKSIVEGVSKQLAQLDPSIDFSLDEFKAMDTEYVSIEMRRPAQ